MSIEDEVKTKDAETIVRFLANAENFGKKFTPYLVSKSLEVTASKIYSRKIEKLLSMLTIRFPDIFGFEKLSNSSYFWIQTEQTQFLQWFQNWFHKEF